MSDLKRWDLFQGRQSLQDEAMNELIGESFVRPGQKWSGQGFVQGLDLSETDDSILIEAALPGLKPEDLEIAIENNVLTIKGERRQEADDKKRNYHRSERRFGSFQRSITLPDNINVDAIQASFSNGLLRLDIPKTGKTNQPRVIDTQVENTSSSSDEIVELSRDSDTEVAEAYAVARIKDHEYNQPFYTYQKYVLEVGVQRDVPEGFEATTFTLPGYEENIQFEIVVYAEDMEIMPTWIQSYVFNRDEDPRLVEFILRPNKPGYKQIYVEFLYQRHWLAKIQLEVEVVKGGGLF